MSTITINNEKNGIEVRFDSKPDNSVIESLKANGFRWSGKRHMWYVKNTDEKLAFARGLVGENIITSNADKKVYDLWELTRTDNIPGNHDYIRKERCNGNPCKSLAGIIRQEIKNKFPMVKASVRKDGYHSITVEIKSSPFAKDSEELKAVVHYLYMFAESYNYNNSDYMSDYYDVGFYGVYENNMVSYDYVQTEADTKEISELFAVRKAEFEKAEAERKEKEYQEYLIKRKQEEEEAEKWRIQSEAECKEISESVQVKDVEKYFILNLIHPGFSKACRLDEYAEDKEHYTRTNAKIIREIRFPENTYNLFTHHLLEDFDFFGADFGGSGTDDLRIKSCADYSNMTKEERESVETYEDNCVAVFCGDELKFVVDPEGYSYARYCFLIDDDIRIVKDYKTSTGIPVAEYEANAKRAQEVTAAAAPIIARYPNYAEYGNQDSISFKTAMKSWLHENNFRLDAGTVRAIEDCDLKQIMYAVLNEVTSISEQFADAELSPGQKITIIQISDFGGLSVSHGVFVSAKVGAYAQYSKAVHLVFRPENKRQDYHTLLYRDVIVYDGWRDVPESLLWDTFEDGGVVCRKTKFMSCDMKMYDAVLNYYKQQNILPVVNTYKPEIRAEREAVCNAG